jgi:hypothetical protein
MCPILRFNLEGTFSRQAVASSSARAPHNRLCKEQEARSTKREASSGGFTKMPWTSPRPTRCVTLIPGSKEKQGRDNGDPDGSILEGTEATTSPCQCCKIERWAQYRTLKEGSRMLCRVMEGSVVEPCFPSGSHSHTTLAHPDHLVPFNNPRTIARRRTPRLHSDLYVL